MFVEDRQEGKSPTIVSGDVRRTKPKRVLLASYAGFAIRSSTYRMSTFRVGISEQTGENDHLVGRSDFDGPRHQGNVRALLASPYIVPPSIASRTNQAVQHVRNISKRNERPLTGAPRLNRLLNVDGRIVSSFTASRQDCREDQRITDCIK